MLYLFAVALPPAAILFAQRPVQAGFNALILLIELPLYCVFGVGFILWALCVFHAVAVVHNYEQDRRTACSSTRSIATPRHAAH